MTERTVTRATSGSGGAAPAAPVPVVPEAAPGLPLPVAASIAVAAGLALVLAFPSTGWWPLAPVAVAGFALAARGRRARGGAALGLLFGLAFLVPHLSWTGIYVGPVPWFALAGVESLYFTAMGALLPAVWRVPGGGAGTTVATAGLWVAQEALRGSWPFGGFPWGRLAFSQSESPLLGLAAIGGAPVLTAAVAGIGALLAVAVLRLPALLRGSAGRRRDVVRVGGALLGVAVVLVAGLAVPRPTEGRPLRVAAVQGNVPRAGLEFNAERRAVLDNHARVTEGLATAVTAGRSPRPDLVVWPENASDIDPLRNPDARAVIDRAVDAVGAPTLVGTVLREPGDDLSNTTLLWRPGSGPGTGPQDRYVKQHPVPFGEYIPYRSFFRRISSQVDLVPRDFVGGDRTGVIPVGPARVGSVICFEVAYDGLVRDTVRAGAQILAVQTNNATFGRTDESVQQLAMSRIRALESGRSVVHISTVGISALIEPDGTIVRRSGHFRQDLLEAEMPLRTGRTLATRLGAAPEWAFATASLVLVGAAALRRRRATGEPAARAAG